MINNKRILRKLDIVFGAVLVVLGIVFALQSYKMPWNGISGGGVMAAPGLLPLIVSLIIAVCGIILIVSAWKEGARISREDIKDVFRTLGSRQAIRIYIMLLIIGAYIFGLVGRIHFALATFIFLAAFFLYVRAGKWWSCLILAAVVAAVISYAFGTLLSIPLP